MMKFIRNIYFLFICLIVITIDVKYNALEIGMLTKASTGLELNMELQMNLEKNNNKNKYRNLEKKVENKKHQRSEIDKLRNKRVINDLQDLQIYYQSWMKYLKISDGLSLEKSSKKQKQFYKNDLFAVQTKNRKDNKNNIWTKDSDDIPSELHFYGVLYKHSLILYSSRDDTIQRTIDVLNIDDIRAIPEGGSNIGGVKDFGKFDEGYCFRVLTRVSLEPFVMSGEHPEPKVGVNTKWVFCLDNENNKKELMNLLIKLKLEKQHSLGIYLHVEQKGNKEPEVVEDIQTVSTFNQKVVAKSSDPKDGYWIILQDWSQCTLKCGGGLQYQQLICNPPQDSGKPCEGPAIRTRPCNNLPCPDMLANAKSITNAVTQNVNDDTTQVLPPVLKMMNISKRPRRYDKCVIKEDDAFISRKDPSNPTFTNKIPARIVLNDKTFSIFQDDEMKSLILSFLIKETTLSRVSNQPRCFILSSTGQKQAQICQLDTTNQKQDWIDEWEYDYNLFKYQCFQPRSKSDITIDDSRIITEQIKEKIKEIKKNLVKEKIEEVKKTVHKKEETQMQSRIEQVKQVSVKALQKEIKLEQLLEQEEKEREEVENKEIQKQILHEENKEELLLKAIKEKQIEDQYNISKYQSEQTIQKITNQTKQDIAMKRLMIKKKIAEMRHRQERRKKELETKLTYVRTALAEKLGRAAKIGSMDICFNPEEEENIKMIKYCEDNYSGDYMKFRECRSLENFCYVCCENEFGDLHLVERNKCYHKCDTTINK